MPPVQSTVYTTSEDIAGLMGASGLTLRLDDAITISGGISGATNTSPIVITTPIAHGLTTGDVVLIFGVVGLLSSTVANAANTEAPITVINATSFSLNGSEGNDTYFSGGAWFSTGTSQPLTIPAINVATAKVNRFCQPLYDVSDLANSWSVWQWATVIACHWICARRNNPIPGSLNNMYIESMDELAAVRATQIAIEDIGYRNNIMPMWSALRVDRRTWSIKQMRVENSLSDRTRATYPQQQDLAASVVGPYEIDSI